MSIAKVIEVLAEGPTIEAAAESALAEAGKTVHNIKHLYLRDPQAIVENNKIVKFRINAKVTFVIEH
jgi:flavin-binding protein dodecin